MQLLNYDFARKCDKDLERKIRNRHDTRAAALLQQVTKSGSKGFNLLASANFESLLFGPEVEVGNRVHQLFIVFMRCFIGPEDRS
jgi:hypothetical protein